MTSCYNRAVDKEALRKQVFEEVRAQFETKLRDLKRQKLQVEEELESVSDKWRVERRRLNDEIDRLETDLADAKQTRKKQAEPKKGTTVDVSELARVQSAADEKFGRATEEWETERARLAKEVSKLERTLADLLEKQNN